LVSWSQNNSNKPAEEAIDIRRTSEVTYQSETAFSPRTNVCPAKIRTDLTTENKVVKIESLF